MSVDEKPGFLAELVNRLEKARGFTFCMIGMDDPVLQRAVIMALKAELKRPVVELQLLPDMEHPLHQVLSEELQGAPGSAVVMIYSPTLYASGALEIGEAFLENILLDIADNQGKYVLLGRPMVLFINQDVLDSLHSFGSKVLELASLHFSMSHPAPVALHKDVFIPPEMAQKWMNLLGQIRKGVRKRTPEALLDKAALDYSMGLFAMHLWKLSKARKLLEKAMETFQALGEKSYEIYALLWLMWCELSSGNYDRARELAQRYREFAEDEGEIKHIVLAIVTQHLVELDAGNLDKAEEYLLEALERAPEGSWMKGMALELLGDLALQQDNLEKAAEWYLRTAEHMEGHDPFEAAIVLHKRGEVLIELGRYEEAEENFRKALSAFRRQNDKVGIAQVAYLLAETLHELNRTDEVEKFAKEAFYTARRIGALVTATNALGLLGKLSLDRKDERSAKDYYSQALELARKMGDKYKEVQALLGLTQAFLNNKEYEEAQKYVSEAIKIASKHFREDPMYLRGLLFRGYVSYEQSRYGDARRWFEKFLKALEPVQSIDEFGKHVLRTNAMNYMLDCYLGLNRLEDALEAAQQLLALHREKGESFDIALALNTIGDIYYEMEKWDEALAAFNEALETLKQIEGEGSRTIQAVTHVNLGWVKVATDRLDEAWEHLRQAKELNGDDDFVKNYIAGFEKILEEAQGEA